MSVLPNTAKRGRELKGLSSHYFQHNLLIKTQISVNCTPKQIHKMKRLFILLATLAIPALLLAQSISVKSFRALPTDMTARVTDPVKDQNGDKCALIKVVTTETDFGWEGGMLGVMKAEKKKGEYWVYVPYGAKRITIKHDKLGVLRNYLYPEPIEEATVYEMVLTTGRVETIVHEAEIQKQWLIIKTDPPGATVYINDEIQNTLTPFTQKLDIGSYSYRLEYADYHNMAGNIELTPDKKAEVSIELQPAFGQLQVNSQPEGGATVVIDGKPSGKQTPCRMEQIASGKHHIRLMKKMYAVAEQEFIVNDGQLTTLNIQLKPDFAEISIGSMEGAGIYIDGEFKANTNWSGRLSPGIYQAEARLENHTNDQQSFEVAAGTAVEIDLKPIARTGNADIMSTPIEAAIKIDGKDYGLTPNTARNLIIGEHSLQLSKEGYGTINKSISIIENQTIEINEELPSGKEVTINSDPAGATLSIDGQSYGTTPWTGTLAFGSHSIKLVNGNKTVNEQITISQNGQSSFSFDVSEFSNFTETVNGVSFTMVAVTAGSFLMGSNDGGNDEKPIHEICIDVYYIGQTEVTQALWKAVMNNNPSSFKGNNLPVEKVSWNDAQEFIKKLNRMTGKNFRLPTEAEWEYAARGGASSTSATATYAGSNNIDEVAWYDNNSGYKIHPVARKKANALGISDLSGNVWEWCSDWYGNEYYKNSPRNNPQGASSGSGRVIRGGSWDDGTRSCRSANRGNGSPGDSSSFLGFRLACSVD